MALNLNCFVAPCTAFQCWTCRKLSLS